MDSELAMGIFVVFFIVSMISAIRLLVEIDNDIESYRGIEVKHILMLIMGAPFMILSIPIVPIVFLLYGMVYLLDKYEKEIKKPFKYKPFDRKR